MKVQLQALLHEALAPLLSGTDVPPPGQVVVEATRDPQHGDFATNLALTLAKPLKRSPRQLAEQLVEHLPKTADVERVEIAGPGFINFFLTPAAFQATVPRILEAGVDYGHGPPTGRKVMIEFVSANPTGPLHVGHGRGAAYGDSLARILVAAGDDVHREYYINDAGRQVDLLALSVWLRYLDAEGKAIPFPRRAYAGDYVGLAATELRSANGDRLERPPAEVLKEVPDETDGDTDEAKRAQEQRVDALVARAKFLLGPDYGVLLDFALSRQLNVIRATLSALDVHFDEWFSERALVDGGAVAKAMDRLRETGHVYEQDGAQWLRTSDFGDEKDRVLVKANGAATYFCNDLAYHIDKLGRGHDVLLDVWGADHHGYIGRMRAAIEALTGRPDALQVKLIQFVTLSSGKMGKRSGNYVTLDELLNEAGADETRFFYLMRSHDQHLEFDIELARRKDNDNPVYYVQYACARIASVFRQAEERGFTHDADRGLASLPRLETPQEKQLLVLLDRFPDVVQDAAAQQSPHTLCHYAREVADAFHSWYNADAFLVDEATLRDARLVLVQATGQVLKNTLGLLGVTAPDRM